MDYQPAWLTDEIYKLLNEIGGHNQRKKRTTVLRLAEAYATGGTEASVWVRPDCCARQAWEGKYKGGERQPGWRDDPAIQAALAAATKRAHWWQDQAEARRIAKRQEDLAKARDKLAELAWPAVLKLGAILAADNLETARKAANDILDRADEATATKGVQKIGVSLDDVLGALPPDFQEAVRGELADALSNGGDHE